ncbi:DUF6183 family protein [Microtetraspora malaysiensis]|uniref:DUF6183 family protein n=1 Tax=Microtetraspora malaysiensis TaxID=161358 RepID=UPI003D8FA192
MTVHERRGGPHERALARVPGDAASLAELVRDQYADERQGGRVRDLAALLAERRRVHHLVPLLEHPPEEPDAWAELVACLIQELVARRRTLVRVPAAARCADALRGLGHPLAGLPLKRTRGERRMDAAVLGPGWTPRGEQALPEPPERDAWLAGRGSPDHEPRIVSTREDERRIASAVEHWGAPEVAAVIELPRRIDPQELTPLEVNAFLPGALSAQIALYGAMTSLDTVVNELFAVAYCDASYSPGLRGGYGRLAAWQSVAGLVRAPAGASVHRINELAARWRWTMFRIIRRQPYWVYRELAIGALSPRGTVLSLLVTHDTD